MGAFLANNGGSVALGVRLGYHAAVGACVQGWYTLPGEGQRSADFVDETANFAAGGGFLVNGWEDRLTFDVQATYTTQEERYVDPVRTEVVVGKMPLIVKASANAGFLDSRLFLALKSIGDVYLDDRGGFALRVIPMVEFWPFPFLALRAGYENAHLAQFERVSAGHGFLAGATVKIWKFELSGNFAARQKPVHLLPGS